MSNEVNFSKSYNVTVKSVRKTNSKLFDGDRITISSDCSDLEIDLYRTFGIPQTKKSQRESLLNEYFTIITGSSLDKKDWLSIHELVKKIRNQALGKKCIANIKPSKKSNFPNITDLTGNES